MTYNEENPRFYGMDLDEELHDFPYGQDTHGIVDEEAGGIIAYCHAENTMLLVNALNRVEEDDTLLFLTDY